MSFVELNFNQIRDMGQSAMVGSAIRTFVFYRNVEKGILKVNEKSKSNFIDNGNRFKGNSLNQRST